MKTAETKYKMIYTENQNLYHDRGTSGAGAATTNEGGLIFNPWGNVTKGTDASQRVGDEIISRGMLFKFMYWTAPGRASQYVRVIIAVIPRNSGSTVHDGTNFDLLDPNGSNDTVTGMIKKEGVKTLYDKVYTLKAQGSTDVTATSGDGRLFKSIFIKPKRNQKLAFGSDGYLVNKPLGIWVIPYDEYGTLRTDILGSVSCTCKLYFKDP